MGDFNAKIGSTNNIMEHTIAELNWVFFFQWKKSDCIYVKAENGDI